MSKQRDCRVCLHAKVCRYVQDFQTLMQLGQLEFNCRYCLTPQANSNTVANPKTENFLGKSIEELSREVNGDNEEDRPAAQKGVCHICHTEGEVYICEECGEPTCGKCGDFVETIDMLGGGESITVFQCKDCDN